MDPPAPVAVSQAWLVLDACIETLVPRRGFRHWQSVRGAVAEERNHELAVADESNIANLRGASQCVIYVVVVKNSHLVGV
jgi:hypothetical protein